MDKILGNKTEFLIPRCVVLIYFTKKKMYKLSQAAANYTASQQSKAQAPQGCKFNKIKYNNLPSLTPGFNFFKYRPKN